MNGKNLQKCGNGSSEGTILVSGETEENKILRVTRYGTDRSLYCYYINLFGMMGGGNIGNKIDVKHPTRITLWIINQHVNIYTFQFI
jgi:hypothetical protein